MTVAVASRPVEQFETEVPMPDWQLEPEEEVVGRQAATSNGWQPLVDADGNPDRHADRRDRAAVRSRSTCEPGRHRASRGSKSSIRRSRAATARSQAPAPCSRSRGRRTRPPRRSRSRDQLPPPDPLQPRPDAQ